MIQVGSKLLFIKFHKAVFVLMYIQLKLAIRQIAIKIISAWLGLATSKINITVQWIFTHPGNAFILLTKFMQGFVLI